MQLKLCTVMLYKLYVHMYLLIKQPSQRNIYELTKFMNSLK